MEVSKEVLFLLPGIGADGVIREGFMEEGILEWDLERQAGVQGWGRFQVNPSARL